jgi:dipeptide transport system substrate-binding protein
MVRSISSALLAAALVIGAGSAAHAKLLTYCSEAAPEGFDPAPHINAATFDASSQLFYDRLTSFVPGTTEIQPGLSDSWNVSADGKVYTFHIRPGVLFHRTEYFSPSRPLNADDVVFSLNRQRDKKNPWYGYAGGSWPYFSALGLDSLIKAVDKVDSSTVRITLTQPNAGLLADLAMDSASILSKEYADSLVKAKTLDQLDALPIGTGPFVFLLYRPGEKLYTAANAAYWRGVGPLSNLDFVFVPDAAARLAKLKAGECDVSAAPDAGSLAATKADPSLDLITTERADIAYLAYNTTNPAFADPRVRKAIGMAIDRKAIVDAVYGGSAQAAAGLLPASMFGASDGAAASGYSVDGAKALLTEAGVTGLKVKLLATRTARPYSPDLGRTADMIAADLGKVGIEATVATPPQLGDYLRQSADKARDSAVLIGWTSDNGDPDNFLSLLLSCEAVGQSNRTQWCDPAFTKALGDARVATDPAERARLYGEAQKIVADQAPLIPLVHTLVAVPVRKGVTGVVADPLGRHNFAKADIAAQ